MVDDSECSESTILTLSGDNFFSVLQKELRADIPKVIKNILKLFDYNCAIVLARFDDASIISIEEDLRNNFSVEMLLEGETLADYLGRFEKCQKKFKFLDGQRKWFLLIAETCRCYVGNVPQSTPTTEGREIQPTDENPEKSENGNSICLIFEWHFFLSHFIQVNHQNSPKTLTQ